MRSYDDLNINYQSGDLSIKKHDLTSLVYCPEIVSGEFNCETNNLTNLIGGPQRVDGNYFCEDNLLTDLAGCASHISCELNISNNQITSLVGIHKIIKSCSEIYFDCDLITQGGIGLLLIENLTMISNDTMPFIIIERYLGTGTKGMMECRAVLIASGYENYAKL